MTVGEYIEELLEIIEALEEYEDNEQLTVHQDETGYRHFIVGDLNEFRESCN